MGNTANKDELEHLGIRQFREPSPEKVGPLDRVAQGQVSATYGSLKRRQCLTFDEEEELVSILREMIKSERAMEDKKVRLAGRPDFNLQDAFQLLDRHAVGSVTGPQIIEALASFGIHVHKEDVYLWVRRYDKDNDGRVLFSDFSDAFTPANNAASLDLGRRIGTGAPCILMFNEETKDLFFSVLRAQFAAEEDAEISRQRVSRRPTSNVHD